MAGVAAQLLERSTELDLIGDAIEQASSGRGSVVLIEGPAGVGKTSLLRVATALAESAGFRVLTAIGGVVEADSPWNLVRQLFGELISDAEYDRETLLDGAAALAAPALGLGGSAEAGSLHGLYWLTASLAERRPVMLVVDDAHWGDDPSLRYIEYLTRRIGDLPMVLAVGSRSGEDVREPLAALATAAEARFLTLADLSPGAAAELTRRRLGAGATQELCVACHRVTGGSPFLLEALLDQLESDGLDAATATADAVEGVTPETVRRSVLLRLLRLPSSRRELAESVALLGAETGLAEAGALAGLTTSEAAEAADGLARNSLLEDQGPLRFRHPLVREIVYGEIPAHERARRHGDAARLLWRLGGDRQRILAQLLLSEPGADPWVVARLREGGKIAIDEGVPQAAADLLVRALREPPPRAQRAELLNELGRAELAAGRPDAARHLRDSLELVSDPVSRARTALGLGRGLYVTGHPREAAEVLDEGHRELGAGGATDPSLAGELRAAWLAVARTEMPLRAEAARMALRIAADPPGGDTYGERALLAQVSGELTFAAQPRDRALRLARAALADGELIAEETSDGLNWIAAMGALGWGDDFDGYDRLHLTAQADAHRRGSVIGLVNGSYGLSFSHYYRGRLASAAAAASQAIEAAADGWIFFLPAARAQLAWSLIELGDLAQAEQQLRRAELDPTWENSSMQGLVLEARARVALARGQFQAALELALEAGRIFAGARIENPSILPWRSRAAVAAARLGEIDLSVELANEALTISRRFGAPRPIGIALMAAAQGKDALETLEEAVAVLADSPARLEYGRALVLFGAALRRSGLTRDARGPLVAGLDIAAESGSRAIEERARSELAAAGARPRRARSTGLESLTGAELRTAEHAAAGLTNREIAESLFVSLRTVETHLTHTYGKLGISSRTQLPESLRQTTRV